MSRIAIIGDTHFSPKTPVSRKDDYPSTLFNKLNSLLTLCIRENVTDCIFLGDLINANQMTVEYMVRLYGEFIAFKNNGIDLHTVIGNHDMAHSNIDYLNKSAIALFISSGLFSTMSFVKDDTYFELIDYYVPVNELKPFNAGDLLHNIKCKVMCGHYFYLNGFNDMPHTISPDMCKELNYNYYFLGHDHTPYDPLVKTNYEVHRPGSFSRATSDTCQVNRDNIQICIFDTDTHKVEYKDIPDVLPSKDVYKESKLISKLNESDLETTLSEDIDNLIDSMSFDFSSDIYTVLDSLDLKEEIKDKVTEYLMEEGLFRHE